MLPLSSERFLKAWRLVRARLLPELAQFGDAVLLELTLVGPVAEGVADDLAGRGVLPGFDGLPHLGDHLRRQRDGYLFDGWHGGPPWGGMTSCYHSNIPSGFNLI